MTKKSSVERRSSETTRYPLPECVVQPRSSVEVYTSYPGTREPFTPAWFLIPDEAARHLLVTDIKVGKNSQNASCACVPASLFSKAAWRGLLGGCLRMVQLRDGMEIRLSLTNTSTEQVRFAGEVVGYHGDEPPPGQRLYLCGLGHNLVQPGGSFRLSVQPQVSLSPRRLFVPDDVLSHFVVRRAEVLPSSHGYRDDQGCHAAGGIPAVAAVPPRMLTRRSLRAGGEVRFVPASTLQPSAFICLDVVNESGEPQWFGGAMLG
jgi:hypothetical protein